LRLLGSSNSHDGGDDTRFLLVRLLGALGLGLTIHRANGRGRAGEGDLESLVVVESELLVAKAAAVTERHDGGASASTRATTVGGLVLTKVDKAVDKVLFGLDVGEILKEGAVGEGSGEIESGLGRGCGD
jgi:hypothetical protein